MSGLTAAVNRAFVEGLGCYDRVLTYEQIASLPVDQPTVFVDMAGNGAVVSALHHHLRDNLKYSCIVGLTHWERRQGGADLPGAAPTFFFAPTRLQKRTQEWGAEGLQQRYRAAWRQFVEFVTPRIRVVHGRGPAAVERVYLDTLEGRSKPDEGHILSLSSPEPVAPHRAPGASRRPRDDHVRARCRRPGAWLERHLDAVGQDGERGALGDQAAVAVRVGLHGAQRGPASCRAAPTPGTSARPVPPGTWRG